MSNILCGLNESELTVETCILQLVKIALKRRASAIAVRIDYKKRKIQVVDNSNGYTKSKLASIFDKKSKVANEEKKLFERLRCTSYAVIITSKHEPSSYTYVKVADMNKNKLLQGYDRPSKGTTVTIYDYHSTDWDQSNKSHSISYVLSVLALVELKVSFSLRNDNENKIIFNVGKPHSPWAVFKQIKINQYYEKVLQPVSQVVNSKINDNNEKCVISEEAPKFALPNDPSPIHSFDQNNPILNNNACSPLSVWSNWSYKPKLLVMQQNINVDSDIFFSSTEKIDVSKDAYINLSQLSVWSDWAYVPEKSNFNNIPSNSRFKFLPIAKSFNNYPKLTECRISSNTINSLQIIKQINSEFIVAVANENGKKLLIIIDQHAIHERIRYEWLIQTYREKDSYSYRSEKLYKDLLIPDFDKNLLKLIRYHKEVPMRVGINVKGIIGSNACVVDAVPKCFVKSKRIYSDENETYRLMKNVKNLLEEVAKGLSHNVLPPILPITINNVIASEACRGAIKFGDPLNVKDCTVLIQALQETKAPTRCAHGRPSIVPLLDLKELEKQKSIKNKRLNFASLMRYKSTR